MSEGAGPDGGAPDARRRERYSELLKGLTAALEGESDAVAMMATVACELHHAFDHFDWTGFYRVDSENARELVIGPYQGTHGCLRIAFDRGVCGAAAREKATQRVDDVSAFAGHIACSASTRSEIAVPVLGGDGALFAVLDVDSDAPAAFDDEDRAGLEAICAELGRRFFASRRAP